MLRQGRVGSGIVEEGEDWSRLWTPTIRDFDDFAALANAAAVAAAANAR